jgi:hypothetical protein
MSVSLVKVPTISPTTIVYVVGYSMGGYSPDPDHVHAYATLDDARSALADELERAADLTFDNELEDARQDYASEADYSADIMAAHEASTSLSGSAELVKSDRAGDIAASVTRHGGWSTSEPDGYVYWLDAVTIGHVFGDDTESDEYLTLVDEITGR